MAITDEKIYEQADKIHDAINELGILASGIMVNAAVARAHHAITILAVEVAASLAERMADW